MHTVTNVMIWNLGLSDILLCLFAVPFTPLYLLAFKSWVFGTALCHLLPFAQGEFDQNYLNKTINIAYCVRCFNIHFCLHFDVNFSGSLFCDSVPVQAAHANENVYTHNRCHLVDHIGSHLALWAFHGANAGRRRRERPV